MKAIIDIEITSRLLTFNCSLRKVGVRPGTGGIMNMRPARSAYSRRPKKHPRWQDNSTIFPSDSRIAFSKLNQAGKMPALPRKPEMFNFRNLCVRARLCTHIFARINADYRTYVTAPPSKTTRFSQAKRCRPSAVGLKRHRPAPPCCSRSSRPRKLSSRLIKGLAE